MVTMANTCSLYGGSTYVTSWLPINLLVILISILLVAVIYSVSTMFPDRAREQLKGAARSELTQALISMTILVILLGAVTTVCTASASLSNKLTGMSMDPFRYATYYIGNLSLNTGINLLTNLYGTSVQYAVAGAVYGNIGNALNPLINSIGSKIAAVLAIKSVLKVGFRAAGVLGSVFTMMSEFYLGVFAPLVTLAVGLLFLQFIMLPIFQYAAFSVLLPIALAVRSVSFLGSNLKFASNALLAIAIAAYIIYPTMIAFNSYAIHWIFSSSNPSYVYVGSTFVVNTITPFSFFQQTQSSETGFFGTMFKTIYPFMASALGSSNFFGGVYNILTLPAYAISQTQLFVNQIAQFFFASIVMFVIDIAVVVGFASGLAKALNSGLEGTGSFWSGL